MRQYRLPGRQASLGVSFEQIYRLSWASHEAVETPRFEQGLHTPAEHLRFIGAPFELPLPHDRWVRIVEQQTEQGQRYGVHADITVLKRQHVSWPKRTGARGRARRWCARRPPFSRPRSNTWSRA
ncbi:hypothetical protein MW290_04885 [Aquincola tertiaricarbonis]|uniref:Uncharacterized protein n=1 Tax=Aquincola tertiaricarbonis TaxID=391953 RepID=A0ABY4S4L2_AQUTE|nr:hypothetical protein [Aquincola tertiaricarbonis]URI07924.1 hypothetical protein MW290_04885 [Aquincola tertiaricarbonis]